LEDIRKRLSLPYIIRNHELRTSPSIGVVIFPRYDESPNDIIQRADTAMYRAKESGRNTIRFYTDEMQAVANKRISMENDLRSSIDKNELRLLYQPQISQKGKVLSCESLIRWNKDGKIVSPVDFIPLAEETGIIIDIGAWVLNQSCEQFKLWQADNAHANNKKDNSFSSSIEHIAVNVSPKQFRDANFVRCVEDSLMRHNMKPSELELEITEGIVIANVSDTINKMQQLKEMGVRLAMDDFGTGYSSLSYLKKLPLDILKIDQSFIRDANIDLNDRAIVSTIIAMAKKLEMTTVAEGIEDDIILKFLDQEGCDVYQGYFFGKPMQDQDFFQFLLNWKGIAGKK
jgi:EAL domain-containing protein (putative c-di-GMP-specific phosphodiesterase class I)